MTGQAGTLSAWLDPVTDEEFRGEYLGRRSLYNPPTPRRLATLDGLCSWTVPDLLADRAQSVVAWFTDTEGRHLTTDVSPVVAKRLHAGGMTLYLADVPGLGPLAADIAASLRVPGPNVRATLFCNRPGAVTPMHFDPVDTITIQVTGSKRWWIAPNDDVAYPTVSGAHHEVAVQPELWQYSHDVLPGEMPPNAQEHLLTPGSVLYVPRGWWHRTESDEDAISLHLHQIQVPWVDAVLTTLRARLVRDDTWRAGPTGLWDPDRYHDSAADVLGLLDDLAKVVTALHPADVLPGRAPGTDPPTAVVRRAGAGIAFRDRQVIVNVNEYGVERRTTLEVSAAHAAVCRDLAARTSPTWIDDLADVEDLPALIDELVAAGFVRPVPTG